MKRKKSRTIADAIIEAMQARADKEIARVSSLYHINIPKNTSENRERKED